MAKIKESFMNEIIRQHSMGNISFSRMVELINQKANQTSGIEKKNILPMEVEFTDGRKEYWYKGKKVKSNFLPESSQPSEVSDEDIEAWAESKEPNWRTDVDNERYYRGRVLGAKAYRDGLITKK